MVTWHAATALDTEYGFELTFVAIPRRAIAEQGQVHDPDELVKGLGLNMLWQAHSESDVADMTFALLLGPEPLGSRYSSLDRLLYSIGRRIASDFGSIADRFLRESVVPLERSPLELNSLAKVFEIVKSGGVPFSLGIAAAASGHPVFVIASASIGIVVGNVALGVGNALKGLIEALGQRLQRIILGNEFAPRAVPKELTAGLKELRDEFGQRIQSVEAKIPTA